MNRPNLIRDERGMTLVELLVATSAGIVVMLGISLSLIVTMRSTARVANHVEANQRARLTMSKIIDQLHSACIASKIAPIQGTTATGVAQSTGSSLVFLHQTGSAVSPTPVKSSITLSGTTLTQTDYAVSSGAAPSWVFSSSPFATTQIATDVSALSASVPVFRYYGFANGKVATTSFPEPLSAENALKTVQVSVAFKSSSTRTLAKDANAPTAIQDAAILRLTPPSFETSAENGPCV